MTTLPIELTGEKMRKAIADFCEIVRQNPEKPKGKILEKVSQRYDLSPLECDFLLRQLGDS